ncbi:MULTISPECIES: hypothetical protein [Gammaproteobacteria]|jgi:hypothetical protein|uniref:Transcriptional regulator VspR n=3 Tax=Shewanella TaxID=22 RepID=A0ABQ2RD89_9GAMM|nr:MULTISPECIES: hypothetical protein [Gammaproteobacteria]MCL1103244.1 hypothetical protein [Shewanella saliphila]MCL1159906.1 hypothetical protein [Shewanella inventionis]GGB76037.1 transcriptional regulator VspR [Shewanella inventionis]GGP67397.1 transcriptional regulator VspR [Shewanella saliphila]GGQ22457.1 transcriptional regulator VspR [Shewanella litoralis]|tara:strand:+ start:1164 stop:1673 length:510 start_codon:yes stop_codon:yes gene_type:complete
MLDPFVAQIIKAENFDKFTTSDVRSAYFALKKDPSLDSAEIRRMIYAELMKLVKKGWLERNIQKQKGQTRFKKTVHFDATNLPVKPMALLPISDIEGIDKHKKLSAKLNYYKSELLLSLGESEAYKEIYLELPDLAEELQPKYNLARENSTKLLGKIKAIEAIIEQRNI